MIVPWFQHMLIVLWICHGPIPLPLGGRVAPSRLPFQYPLVLLSIIWQKWCCGVVSWPPQGLMALHALVVLEAWQVLEQPSSGWTPRRNFRLPPSDSLTGACSGLVQYPSPVFGVAMAMVLAGCQPGYPCHWVPMSQSTRVDLIHTEQQPESMRQWQCRTFNATQNVHRLGCTGAHCAVLPECAATGNSCFGAWCGPSTTG